MRVGDVMTNYERELGTLTAKVDQMEADIAKMSHKVDQMHELLLQAKGAKWVILGMASVAGFVAAKLGTLAAMLGVKLPG